MLQAPLTAVFIIGRIAGVHRYWTISDICATLAISGVFCFVIIRIMPAIARIQKINDGITNVNLYLCAKESSSIDCLCKTIFDIAKSIIK